MSSLTAKFTAKESYFGWNLFYLSKKCPKTNLKGF